MPARFYGPFASALAGHGFAAVTFDYRGVGASRPAHLRGFGARMRDWINLDADGVLDWARATYPGSPLLAVGHSVGGHAIGLCEGAQHLKAGVLVCSAAAWLGYMRPARERLRIAFLLRTAVPGLVRAFGYAPLRALGMGDDLPGPAFREWVDWIGRRRYFFDDPTMDAAARFARVRAPMLVIGAEDDPWTPAPAIDLLASYLTAAPHERWQVAPRAGEVLGHVGFFHRERGNHLWPGVAEWLARRAGE